LEEEKQRIFDRIAAEVTAKQREQEEFLELQIVLSMQEAEEKRVREDKARAEKRLRDKVEMMAANEHQKVKPCFRARCVRVAMADEAVAAGDQGADTGAGGGGRGEVPPAHVSHCHCLAASAAASILTLFCRLQKFADDEKTEQMAEAKRRMRVQAHKKAVEDLIVNRREERAAAKAAEAADVNAGRERERLLRETIERERQRILGEHAARLGLDFLPRGLLANQVRCCVLHYCTVFGVAAACACLCVRVLPQVSPAHPLPPAPFSPTFRCSRTLRRRGKRVALRNKARACRQEILLSCTQ
jgi:hypothetical protein